MFFKSKAPRPKIAILISGRGSNMRAIIEKSLSGKLKAEIALVFSDKSDAQGLKTAASGNIPTLTFSPKGFDSFEDYEEKLADELDKRNIDLIVCAGYMRIIRKTLLTRYKGRILNIHPSLLPAFPGLKAQKQAVEYGARVSGCTVHFVDEGVDTGPVIMQKSVEIDAKDSPDDVTRKILKLEHDIYWRAIDVVLKGVRIDGRKVIKG